jgi:hypothetical protein
MCLGTVCPIWEAAWHTTCCLCCMLLVQKGGLLLLLLLMYHSLCRWAGCRCFRAAYNSPARVLLARLLLLLLLVWLGRCYWLFCRHSRRRVPACNRHCAMLSQFQSHEHSAGMPC